MSKRILFQGDSITDCKRNREDFYGMGNGYAHLVEAHLGMENPNEYEFVNRGVSGEGVFNIYERVKEDFIDLAPDYASIYIGVNDGWHENERFEKDYAMLIDEVKKAIPNIKLMIIAPYVLEGPMTCDTEDIPDRLSQFRCHVAEKTAASKRIAEKYGLPFIELQPAFDEACKKAEPSYWSYDGVHPTAKGHELIKRLWLSAFETIK